VSVGLFQSTARISNYKRVAILKYPAGWRPISLLSRTLFRTLDQSQTL